MALFKFANVPDPVADRYSVVIDRQRYDLIATEPYVRKDGTETVLLVWQTECAQCSEPFLFRTGLTVHSVGRRCQKHKRPGVRPGGKRRHQPIADTVVIEGSPRGG